MTRAQRAWHPILWAIVALAALTVSALAWRARPAPVPATLPDAAVEAVAEAPEGGR